MIYKWTTSQVILMVPKSIRNYGSSEIWRTLFSGQKLSLKKFSQNIYQIYRRTPLQK